MSVRKDKRKGWLVDVVFTFPDGRTKRVKKKSPVQTKRGAEAYERKLRVEMLDSSATGKSRKEVPTLSKFAEYFVMTYARTNNKASERKSKKMILERHLLPTLGRLRLDEIKMNHIERYKARKLKEGLSPKTINNHLTVLRKALSLAVEDEQIENIPRVKWMKVRKPKYDFFDFEEADRLIEAADGQWCTMIILALKTGVRQGEILGLRWDDVDLKSGQIHINQGNWRGHIDTPKGGRSRTIPLSPQCLDALKKHRHLKGDYVFCQEDGSLLTDNQCRRPLWSACRSAGLRRIGWHVLRHTFASHLVMRGVSLKAVQELLGHTTIEMTMRYAHLSPDVGREAVARLDVQSYGPMTAPRIHASSNSLELL